MKVYLGKPRDHWISPYTILEKVFFWREIDYDEPVIEKWATRLKPISEYIQKILNFIHPDIKVIKLDKYDTWNMDHTLSLLITPMLKQLKDTKHGSPSVDDEDVPEHLRSTAAPPKENEWDTDGNWFLRWDWVMDEMIFAFEMYSTNWEEKFYSGKLDVKWVPSDSEGLSHMVDGPKNTFKIDEKGLKACSDRIDNGFRLFGKYYRSLWD